MVRERNESDWLFSSENQHISLLLLLSSTSLWKWVLRSKLKTVTDYHDNGFCIFSTDSSCLCFWIMNIVYCHLLVQRLISCLGWDTADVSVTKDNCCISGLFLILPSDLYIDPLLPDSWGCSLTARIPQGPNISQHLIGSDLNDFFLAERITNHLYPNIIELICYDFMVHIKLCQGTEAQGAVA